MTRQTQIRPEFVTLAPDVLVPGVVYVSVEYATVLHACCCGCGNTVVTPLAPERWSLTYDGKTISLKPSVGNWSFPCQSHYWIERNAVVWARQFTRTEVAAVRAADQCDMQRAAWQRSRQAAPEQIRTLSSPIPADRQPSVSWWHRLLGRLRY